MIAQLSVDMAFWLIVWADDLNNTVDPTAYSTLNKVQVASLLISVFIPLVVGLVTKRWTDAGTKALLLLASTALAGFITEWANSADFVWQQAVLTWLLSFGTGVVSHYGLWKPTGLAGKAQDAFSGNRPPDPPPA